MTNVRIGHLNFVILWILVIGYWIFPHILASFVRTSGVHNTTLTKKLQSTVSAKSKYNGLPVIYPQHSLDGTS